jgi:hypothetical protein
MATTFGSAPRNWPDHVTRASLWSSGYKMNIAFWVGEQASMLLVRYIGGPKMALDTEVDTSEMPASRFR